jgi:hypothetical protein
MSNVLLCRQQSSGGADIGPEDVRSGRARPARMAAEASRPEPLFWEDVKVGEALPELPKDTYTLSELYTFAYGAKRISRVAHVSGDTIGMGAGGRADRAYARKHPAQANMFDFGFRTICRPGRRLYLDSGQPLEARWAAKQGLLAGTAHRAIVGAAHGGR